MENAENIVKEVKGVQGAVESILRDTLGDYREREMARERRDIRRDITMWMLVVGIVISFLYCQWSLRDASIKHQESIERLATENDIRFKEFLSQYDFSTTIEATQDGGGTNLVGGGDVTNGAAGSNK